MATADGLYMVVELKMVFSIDSYAQMKREGGHYGYNSKSTCEIVISL